MICHFCKKEKDRIFQGYQKDNPRVKSARAVFVDALSRKWESARCPDCVAEAGQEKKSKPQIKICKRCEKPRVYIRVKTLQGYKYTVDEDGNRWQHTNCPRCVEEEKVLKALDSIVKV